MSDNFHKFLFLGAMLVLTVFASRSSGLDGTAVTNGSSPVVAGGDTSTVAVGLPPLNPTGDSYGAASAIGKNTIDDASGADLSVGSSTDAATVRDNKAGVGDAGFYSRSGAEIVDSVFSRLSDEQAPETGAKIALVADLESGNNFYAMNAAMRWPVASITKLMTAEIIFKNELFNESTTITDAEFTVDGSTHDLKAGERYSLADLLNAMLVESNNETAMALADSFGYDAFMKAMNEEAKNLGLDGTYFSDPVGLAAANQSTADDLLAFTQHIYAEYPDILRLTRKTSASLRDLNSGARITVKSINNFAGRADFLGGKTGYTDDASGNLLSIFSYEKRPILIIVMGTEDRFGDTQKLLDWFENNYK